MTSSIPLSDLESSPSAKFENIGDKCAGRIVALDPRQQTSPEGEALSWPDGSARMLWVITVESTDGDRVNLWAKGGNYKPESGTGESMLTAIGTAVRAAGASGVDVGGELAVAFTGLGEKKPGKNAPKLYTAQYRAPQASIPAADLFSKE